MLYSEISITNLVIPCQMKNHPLGYIKFNRVGDNGGMTRKTTIKSPKEMAFPNRIAELSEELGWSQADLARKMNKPAQQIERFWNGKRKLDQIWNELFARVLEYPSWAITSQIPKKEIKAIKTFLEFAEPQKEEFINYMEFLKTKLPPKSIDRKEVHYRIDPDVLQQVIQENIITSQTDKKHK